MALKKHTLSMRTHAVRSLVAACVVSLLGKIGDGLAPALVTRWPLLLLPCVLVTGRARPRGGGGRASSSTSRPQPSRNETARGEDGARLQTRQAAAHTRKNVCVSRC